MSRKSAFLLYTTQGVVIGVGVLLRVKEDTVFLGEIELRIAFTLEQVETFLNSCKDQIGPAYDELLGAARRRRWPLEEADTMPNPMRIQGAYAKALAELLLEQFGRTPNVKATRHGAYTRMSNTPDDATQPADAPASQGASQAGGVGDIFFTNPKDKTVH